MTPITEDMPFEETRALALSNWREFVKSRHGDLEAYLDGDERYLGKTSLKALIALTLAVSTYLDPSEEAGGAE